jgi:hypothetical protein
MGVGGERDGEPGGPMSFFRKLFGGGGEHGQGNRALAPAKEDVLRLLRERGARSAVIAYDGGHDEGAVTEIWISREPLPSDATDFAGELAAAEEVTLDWDEFGHGGLLDAAMDVVADKWGSFAGEFFVKGRIVVDVDGGRMARHDDTWIDDEDADVEEDYDEDLQPKRPPDQHDVEAL